MHSDTEYRPIESPVSHLLPNFDQSVAFCATTQLTIGWRLVHNFLLMKHSTVELVTIRSSPTEDNFVFAAVNKSNVDTRCNFVFTVKNWSK